MFLFISCIIKFSIQVYLFQHAHYLNFIHIFIFIFVACLLFIQGDILDFNLFLTVTRVDCLDLWILYFTMLIRLVFELNFVFTIIYFLCISLVSEKFICFFIIIGFLVRFLNFVQIHLEFVMLTFGVCL